MRYRYQSRRRLKTAFVLAAAASTLAINTAQAESGITDYSGFFDDFDYAASDTSNAWDAPGESRIAQRGRGRQQIAQAAPEQPVGEAPDTRPDVPAIRDRGGVLTPRGTLVLEPGIEYQHDSVSRFVASGVQVIDTVLLGVIDVTEVRRNAVTASMTARYGVTDRLEVEVKVPYVYRHEKAEDTTVEDDNVTGTRRISSNHLGDIEFAGHYQLTDGTGTLPVMVGNLRVKSTTGRGPFDVPFNDEGEELKPPTGSGFWSVEPSVTALIPSDPAVLFGNLGYQWNIGRSVDTQIGEREIGKVRPGDALRTSFGMAFGLNQQLSLSLGYSHDFIMKTKVELDDETNRTDSLQVGSLSFGSNYQWSDSTSLNLNVQVGVTEDAPDVRVLFRVPISFHLL